MSKISKTILDKNKPFSQSKFWHGQRQFYHDKGVDAWAGEVPFYITSNPYIADTYASIIFRFFQDWTRTHKTAAQHPFYMIELGAGSGQFSYYILNKLDMLLKEFELDTLKIHYIITDFTENNLNFWQNHERLKPYIDSKLVDFALFDLERDTTLTTVNQRITLSPGCSENPVTVIANYLFDSIITDIFSVKQGNIAESLVTLNTPPSNLNKGTPINWERVTIEHCDKKITDTHYNDPVLDEILNSYRTSLEDTYLLFPIGSLRGIQNLQKLGNNKLLLLSSDKGFTNTFELDNNEFPELDFHGSFSLMVNYHAIEQFFKISNGDAFIQSPRDNLTTCAFSSGFKLYDYRETLHLLHNAVEEFSPSDFFNFYEVIDDMAKDAELKVLASSLCLSHWDPFIFEQAAPRLIQLFEEEDNELIDYIVDKLPLIEKNFYYVPGCDDVYFSLGLLMYAIDHYKEAIKYYHLSLTHFEPEFEIVYNLALSYFYNEQYKQAAEWLEKSLKFKPRHKETKSLLKESLAHLGQ